MKRRWIIVLAALLIFVGGALLWIIAKNHQQTVLQYMTENMMFEVVTTQAAQERGLGGRATIPDNYGMLFVFPKADRYGFWMKDMLAPIDIIQCRSKENSIAPQTHAKKMNGINLGKDGLAAI